jgi:phosphatidylglycerol:prolipoprotein diacylglycerol transferase
MTPFLAYWVDRLDPFIFRFAGSFGLRWYGVSYAMGFVVGGWLLYTYPKSGRSRVPAAKVTDFLFALILGVVLGGRLGYYILYDGWLSFPRDPFAILRIWDGGMSFHGGLVGVVLAIMWYARTEKLPLPHLLDLAASVAPAGLFFGRIANFINGELWGKPATVPWAVIFPKAPDALPRHPSQIYEALLEGLVLFAFVQLRFWRSDVVRGRPGRLAGEFLILYGVFRILGETFREPDASLILGLSRGTAYSTLMVAAGLFLCLRPTRPLPAP